MTCAEESVIVSDAACSVCSASIVQAHHRDYPEIVAEGMSATIAAEHLADQLARSLDDAPDGERREATERALAEVRDFLTQDDPAPRSGAEGANGESAMAQPHARPGDVIDVRPLGPWLAGARATAVVKTESLEVIRLVIPRGKEIPAHTTRGEATVQCLEGRVAFTTGGVTRELGAGELIYLPGEQPHSLLGIDDASLLVTIALSRDSPLAERLTNSWHGNPLERRTGEGTAKGPKAELVAPSSESGATTPVPEKAAGVPPAEAPGDASSRGGRIDFVSATDLVDEASQESFPASDSPAWCFVDGSRTPDNQGKKEGP